MTHILACIDSSNTSPAVCDYAAWASLNFALPLTLLNVVDRPPCLEIRPGSLAHVLDAMTLDEQRHEQALKQGYLMLQNARERAIADGVRVHRFWLGSTTSRMIRTTTRPLLAGRNSSSGSALSRLMAGVSALPKCRGKRMFHSNPDIERTPPIGNRLEYPWRFLTESEGECSMD